MDALQKWKKAVIHLEGATDSKSLDDLIKTTQTLNEKLAKGEITYEEYEVEINNIPSRDKRYRGTAIFFIHEKKRYLITAKHVLNDIPQEIRSKGLKIPDEFKEAIYPIIFRVPSIDEVIQKKHQELEFLMNLRAGVPDMLPYSFADKNLDLAIISLDSTIFNFADEIISKGYVPITIDDIVDEPTAEGADVFSVGYPGSTSIMGDLNLNNAEKLWGSSKFSVPVFSFGKISMLHKNLNFFWTDISIYPGNSGGPLIQDDKLVGIVVSQATTPVQDSKGQAMLIRIPFGKVIKAKLIKSLLATQIEKDKKSARIFGPR